MDLHNQTHNDIKPQNFLVKFKNGPNDLTRIEIALTDFGMAESDSKGGTPIFASPECFEVKNKRSDIFSFGRVILFLLLTKQNFVRWLFVKDMIQALSLRIFSFAGRENLLHLVSQMTSLKQRISLQSARIRFNRMRRESKLKLSHNLIAEMKAIFDDEISNEAEIYLSELCDLRY